MTHRILVNATGKPMKHPVTEQTIMPGQSYAEPKDMEPVELKDVADPVVTVQTVADPESTKKAISASRRKSGDKQ